MYLMLALMLLVNSGPASLAPLVGLPYRLIERSFSKGGQDDALTTILYASPISTKNIVSPTMYEALLVFIKHASESRDVNGAVKRQLMYPA